MSAHQPLNESEIVKDIHKMLALWQFAASADGKFWIQPRQGSLKIEDFAMLLKRMQRTFRAGQFNTIVFNLERSEVHALDWNLLIRLLASFAQSVDADCTLVRRVTQTSNEVASPEGEPDRTARLPFVQLGKNSVVLVSRAGNRRGIENS